MIQEKWLSVIFDGISHCGEALAILIRYVYDSWNIQLCLLSIRLLSKSLTGEEVAHDLIQVLLQRLLRSSHCCNAGQSFSESRSSTLKYLILAVLAIR